MSVEENKAVVKKFVEGSSNWDLSVIDEVTKENYLFHALASLAIFDKEMYKRMLSNGETVFDDHFIEINDIFADGDKVIIRTTAQDTHKGQLGNSTPTRKKSRYSGFFVFRLEDGKIAEVWDLRDNLSMFQQLGALPVTEEIGK